MNRATGAAVVMGERVVAVRRRDYGRTEGYTEFGEARTIFWESKRH